MNYQGLDHSGRTGSKIVDSLVASRGRSVSDRAGATSCGFWGKCLAASFASASMVMPTVSASMSTDVQNDFHQNSSICEFIKDVTRDYEYNLNTDISGQSEQELVSDLINYLRNYIPIEDREKVAERLSYLHSECTFEEDGQKELSYESLSNFINFLQSNKYLRYPTIGTTYDGYVRAQWRGVGKTKFVIEFLPTNQVKYVIFSHDPVSPSLMERVSGISATNTMMEKAEPYGVLDWISSDDVVA